MDMVKSRVLLLRIPDRTQTVWDSEPALIHYVWSKDMRLALRKVCGWVVLAQRYVFLQKFKPDVYSFDNGSEWLVLEHSGVRTMVHFIL